MTEYLPDTNIFSRIFKGDSAVTEFVENLEIVIDTTIYIECLQGSKSNLEKQKKRHWTIFRYCQLLQKFHNALSN